MDSEGSKTVAAALAVGFTTVTTVVTAIGSAQGGLERMVRNQPTQSFCALALIGMALFLSFAALLLAQSWKPWLLLLASAFFVGGLLWAIQLAVASPSTRERPTIVASIVEDPVGMQLKGSVKAAGLRSVETVRVAVFGLTKEGVSKRLYVSEVGPDTAGKVDLALSVWVPRGKKYVQMGIGVGQGNIEAKCFSDALTERNVIEGCVLLHVPQRTKHLRAVGEPQVAKATSEST